MAKQMSEAGQALLDDVLNIKGGAPAITWTPEQLLGLPLFLSSPIPVFFCFRRKIIDDVERFLSRCFVARCALRRQPVSL